MVATLVPLLMQAFSFYTDRNVRYKRTVPGRYGKVWGVTDTKTAPDGVESVDATEEVRRSRRSSVWPILFYGFSPTSPSGTAAGPRGGSSPRGTGAICLCSGPAGRNHTGG